VASLVGNVAVSLKSRTAIDDTLDVFPCHGLGGMVGMVATGLFAKDVGLFYGPSRTFLFHLLALVLVAAFSFAASYCLYRLVDLLVGLRVTREEERLGLDLSQHGETVGESAAAIPANPGELEPMDVGGPVPVRA
jgi:Amt family ammonium transporter